MPRLSPIMAAVFALALSGGCVHPTVSAPERTVMSPRPWAHEIGDLKPDPAVVWGRLDNGLRYAIRPNAMPQRRASVRLLVEGGSYQERDDEMGYAHFLEHLAFRGTREFPGRGVIDTLQRLGAQWGAETSFFETVYHFDGVPVDDTEAVATALKILRGMAAEMLIRPEDVAGERGVIFGEARSRDAVMAHALPDEQEFLAPREEGVERPELESIFEETRLLHRWAIGNEDVLRAANAQKLRAFYERWYRPERMIVTLVGDVPPKAAERLIRKLFSPLIGRGPAPVETTIEPPAAADGNPQLRTHNWSNEPAMKLTLGVSRSQIGPDSVLRRRRSLVDQMALAMLDQRLGRVEDRAEAPFTSAETVLSHMVPGYELMLLRTNGRPAAWPQAMEELWFELRRAKEQGFGPLELSRAAKFETRDLAVAARQADNRPSGMLADALAYAIARGVVFTTPEDDLRLSERQLATITPEECSEALRALTASLPTLTLAGPLDGTAPLAAANTALNHAQARELTAYAPPPAPRAFPYAEFGSAGTVVKSEHSALLDTDLIQFANGVRLNLKRTQFEPGQVRLAVRIEGGRLAAPPDKPDLGLRAFAWTDGGLDGLTAEEESEALSEVRGTNLALKADELRLTSRADSVHLPLLMQAAAAYFVHPAFREEPAGRSAENVRQWVAKQAVNAMAVANYALLQRMLGDLPTAKPPDLKELERWTLSDVKAWVQPQLAAAPLEIALVGDFEREAAIDAVARTFGTLAARRPNQAEAERTRVTFPPKTFTETVTFAGREDLGVVALLWPVTDCESYAARFQSKILEAIFRERLVRKVRSEMGETYVANATMEWYDCYTPKPAFLSCMIEVAPDRAERVLAAAHEVATTLARDGVTAEEVERARRPHLRGNESGLRDNDWWLDDVVVAQSNPAYAEGWARILEALQSATVADINALARRVIVPERESRLTVRPK